MNKSAIKNFAISARRKLIEGVEQKAYELGITKTETKEPIIYEDGFHINQKFYKKYEMKQHEKLIAAIKEKGFDQVIEEVAYTWFNRFIAIRFMEVNDYLPSGIRVFSSIIEGKTEPDAVTEVDMIASDLDLDMDKVYQMQDNNDTEDLFKYILVKQCNKLGEIMPVMFERIQDYSELLLPDNLLAEGSVIREMLIRIDENDWTEQVEIIGWLYQFYISEKKDQVFADLNKNKKITKENLPAATQLFTPEWIVKYMVENSLGRLWLESHPNEDLQQQWKYYLEEAEQESEVKEKLAELKNQDLSPEEITFLDPSMGSGHILVYAFDVFYEIYKSQGYTETDIPYLILEKNLFGLEIDKRAGQLAYFALIMKARKYDTRLFNRPLKPHLHWFEESNTITEQDIDVFVDETVNREDIISLVNTFKDAKMHGSILQTSNLQLDNIKVRVETLNQSEDDMFIMDFKENTLPSIESLVKQSQVLSNKYNIVVTNPPYMGRKGMSDDLSKFVKKHYSNSSADLFAVFMEVCSRLTKENGFISLINQQAWMFLSSFEELRKFILSKHQTYSMAHLGPRAFAEIDGEKVQTTTFVLRKKFISNYNTTFIRLVETKKAEEKANQFFNVSNYYVRTQESFSDIPESPVSYWASNKIINTFRNSSKLGEIADAKAGLATGDNDYFQRVWFEVKFNKIGFNYKSIDDTKDKLFKWFPCDSGGFNRKWYANKEIIVDWFNDGEAIRNFRDEKGKLKSRPQNTNYYFKKGLTWNKLSTSNFSVRYKSEGAVYDDTSRSAFPVNSNDTFYLLALLSSRISTYIMHFLNPTMSFTNGDIKRIPILTIDNPKKKEKIEDISQENISVSKSDWDSFETSWDFNIHPLLEFKNESTKLADAYTSWEQQAEWRFSTLKANEEEVNRIFINIYGLQDELTHEVGEKGITVRRADRVREVKSFISYAVGNMFGRYSLDQEGLVFAGGEFDHTKYQTFKADVDNIIPITDDEYFEDDMVNRFVKFVRVTFGTENLEENLDFVADALTRKANETARQRIRRYFLKEFYKDHVQMYQKRPIYWLFDSGKNDGFKALVYMHRYEPGLAARVRTDYLHMLQKKYEAEIGQMDLLLESDVSTSEKTKAKKRKEKLQKQLLECVQYDQVIAHLANQKVDIDLDDGVKVNYSKFQGVEIPQGEGKKPLKADVLAKI